MPAANGVVVKIQKLRYLRATLPIVQQKKRIGSTGNTVILALAAHARFKLNSFRASEKI